MAEVVTSFDVVVPTIRPIELDRPWQWLTKGWQDLTRGYQAVLDACCDAWNRLRAIPGKIRTITARDWARTVSV